MLLLIGGTTFILWVLFYRPVEGAENANGVMHAAVMTLRFIAMLLAGIFFLSVTALEDFSNGLMLLKVPYAAAFAVSLSFRLVNTFISTGFLIVEAQEARGNDATRGNIIKRMKAYVPLLVPLILNGIKKAETLNLALESKGFSPQNKPDISGRYKMKAIDTAALLALGISSIIFIAAKFIK
jgi:energy-coupling factor transport system permease protein